MPSSVPKLLSSLSIVCGVVGLLLMLVFLWVTPGSSVFYIGLGVGLLGIVLAVVALAKRQSKVLAMIGMVLSSVTVLAAVGLILFALIFIGAIEI